MAWAQPRSFSAFQEHPDPRLAAEGGKADGLLLEYHPA